MLHMSLFELNYFGDVDSGGSCDFAQWVALWSMVINIGGRKSQIINADRFHYDSSAFV